MAVASTKLRSEVECCHYDLSLNLVRYFKQTICHVWNYETEVEVLEGYDGFNWHRLYTYVISVISIYIRCTLIKCY